MTALPSEDLGEAEDLWLIPPMEYSISEGSRVIPAPLQKSLNGAAVRSSQLIRLANCCSRPAASLSAGSLQGLTGTSWRHNGRDVDTSPTQWETTLRNTRNKHLLSSNTSRFTDAAVDPQDFCCYKAALGPAENGLKCGPAHQRKAPPTTFSEHLK